MTRRDSLGMVAVLLLGALACGAPDTTAGESDEETTEMDVAPEDTGSDDLEAEENAGRDAEDEELGTVLTELMLRSCEDAPLDADCRSSEPLAANSHRDPLERGPVPPVTRARF